MLLARQEELLHLVQQFKPAVQGGLPIARPPCGWRVHQRFEGLNPTGHLGQRLDQEIGPVALVAVDPMVRLS